MERQKLIGENLKRARGARSRAEIAQRAGIIQMYENGERVPRDPVKIRLASVLGASVAELFYPEYFFTK